jgi:hypothetical protein
VYGIRTVLALFGCFETSIVSTFVDIILLEVIDQLTCARGHLGLNHFVGGLIPTVQISAFGPNLQRLSLKCAVSVTYCGAWEA